MTKAKRGKKEKQCEHKVEKDTCSLCLVAASDPIRYEKLKEFQKRITENARSEVAMKLQYVVGVTGMEGYCDFLQQEAVLAGDDRHQPDMIIRLPNNKNIVVDSKVRFQAFHERSLGDENFRVAKLKEYVQDIRNHVISLGSKEYWDQLQPAPESVILFLYKEILLTVALEHDPDILDFNKDLVHEQVIIATPNTMIRLLTSIGHVWCEKKSGMSN